MSDQTTAQSEARAALATGDTWFRDSIKASKMNGHSRDSLYSREDDPHLAQTHFLRSIALSLAVLADAARADAEWFARTVDEAKKLGARL